MPQLTVGLDLGNDSIKRVRLRSTFRSVEVVDYTRIPLPQDDRPKAERLAEALGQLADSSHDTDLLATALPGDEVSVRMVTLPFSDRKKIEQTIGLELERQIPFPINDVVYDYMVAGQTEEGGSRILVALGQKERIAVFLETLAEAQMDPRLLGPESLAFSSLTDSLGPMAEDSSMAVLDMGHRLSSLCIVGSAGVEFARTLSGGGHDLTVQLAETFRVGLAEAEEGKRRGVAVAVDDSPIEEGTQKQISDAVRRSTSTLIRELRQTLSAHHSLTKRPVKKIWLCGGGSAIAQFDRFLAQELEIDTERIQQSHFSLPGIDRLAADLPDDNSWAKALGLALQSHHAGRRGWLNLRKGPFSFRGDFDAVRGKVLHVVVAVIILLLLAGSSSLTRYFSLRSSDRTLNTRMKEITQVILGKAYDDIEVAMAIMKDKTGPASELLPKITAPEVLRVMHERIPETSKLRMKELSISPKRIQLSGFTESFESVEKIRSALQEYECFTEIQTGKTQKTVSGSEVEFRLTIVFGC